METPVYLNVRQAYYKHQRLQGFVNKRFVACMQVTVLSMCMCFCFSKEMEKREYDFRLFYNKGQLINSWKNALYSLCSKY